MRFDNKPKPAGSWRWLTSFHLVVGVMCALAGLLALGIGILLVVVITPSAPNGTTLQAANPAPVAISDPPTQPGPLSIQWQTGTSEALPTSQGNILYDVPYFTGTLTQSLISPDQEQSGDEDGVESSSVEFSGDELIIIVAFDGERFTVTQPEGNGSPIALERPEIWDENDSVIIEQQLVDGSVIQVENLSSLISLLLFNFETERDGIATEAYSIYRQPAASGPVVAEPPLETRWEARFQEPDRWVVSDAAYTVADGITTISERSQTGDRGQLTTIPLQLDRANSLTVDMELIELSPGGRLTVSLVGSDEEDGITIVEVSEAGSYSITIDEQLEALNSSPFQLRLTIIGEDSTLQIGILQIVPTNQSMTMELATTSVSQPIVAGEPQFEAVADDNIETEEIVEGEGETETESAGFLIANQDAEPPPSAPSESSIEEDTNPEPAVVSETVAILPQSVAPAWIDTFDSPQPKWQTSGLIGEVGLDGTTRFFESDIANAFGRLESETINVDLSASPFLKIVMSDASFPFEGEYEIEVVSKEGQNAEEERYSLLTGNTSGTNLIDLRELTGWAGNRTFQIIIWIRGESGSITLDEITVQR